MEGQAQVDVELEREGPLKTFYRLIAHPTSEFERLNGKSDATLPLVFITLIGIIGLANEMVLLSKVSIAELPPFGFSGPPMIESLLAQLPALIYLYYFFESILFSSFEAIFNFAAVWVVLWLAGKLRSVHGDAKSLFYFSFLSLAPLLITGTASLIPTLSLPNIGITAGETSAIYMSLLSKNAFYVAWEYLGWIGEIWVAGLTALSAKATHNLSGHQVVVLVMVILAITMIRIYYLF